MFKKGFKDVPNAQVAPHFAQKGAFTGENKMVQFVDEGTVIF